MLLGKGPTLDFGSNAAELKLLGEEFAAAQAKYNSATSEDEKLDAGLAMERIKETAEALATATYESSEWAQKVLDDEITQITAIRDNTKDLPAALQAYLLDNAFTKGGSSVKEGFSADQTLYLREQESGILGYSSAYGLRRVPFNGYPILAHQDERLLTAEEAREQDRKGHGGVQVNFTGPITVRQDSDLDELARRLADQIEQARDRAG